MGIILLFGFRKKRELFRAEILYLETLKKG